MSSVPFSYVSLSDWQLIKVSGDNNQQYLQGQVTVDVNRLTETHALLAAHCDAKGKMWSNLLLFKRGNDIYYIVRKSVADKQISELKKYSIFSKVAISPVEDLNMIGIIGASIPTNITSLLGEQNCLTEGETTYIKLALPSERIIMISSQPLPENTSASEEWLKLDIQAGYPIIDAENMGSLLPQASNLHNLDAISFDKGCYCGQEMVARAQFRGANKRGMYLLSGASPELPIIGDTLECLVGDNWRETGLVLAAFKQKEANGQMIYVQAVLNNNTDIETPFRVKNQFDSYLKL